MDLLITIGVIVASIAVAFGALRQKIIDHEKQYEAKFKGIEKQCEDRFNIQQDMLKEIRIDIKMMLLREREYDDRNKREN